MLTRKKKWIEEMEISQNYVVSNIIKSFRIYDAYE